MNKQDRQPSKRGLRQARTVNPGQRLLIVLVIAVLLGVAAAVVLSHSNNTVGKISGRYHAVGPAAQALESLRVNNHPHPHKRYNRDAFGYRKLQVANDPCDVREHVLARDLQYLAYTALGSCKVKSGVLQDPYTGKTIKFLRGPRTSPKVQIDHVVALQNAWESGAWQWSQSKRYQFGNDMYNLLAVDGPANEEKSSSSAAYWLPSNMSFRCAYVARQIGVKKTYDLSITSKEKLAMSKVLHNCPGEQLPAQ